MATLKNKDKACRRLRCALPLSLSFLPHLFLSPISRFIIVIISSSSTSSSINR